MYPEHLVHCSKGKILTWLIVSLLLASLLGTLPSPTTVVFSASDPVEGSRANPVEATTPYPPSFQPTSNNLLLSNWSEGFDDITLLPGMGWALINNSDPLGVTNWFQGNPTVFPAHSGNTNSYIAANFNSTSGVGTISNWLLTPEIVMNDGDTLTFYTRREDSQWQDRLQVRLSINGASMDVGTTATSVGDFTTILLDINPTYAPGGYPIVWTQYTITLSGLGGATNGRLAFRYFVENGGPSGANSDYIGIDTVEYTTAITTPPWHKWIHTCIPAEMGPFAFVKQPWGWVEGVVNPDAPINATLIRGSSVIASASTTADMTGWFSLEFLQDGIHLDILSGDQVLVSGGGLDETLTIPEIIGHINVNEDSVAGQISGVPIPALGDVCVRLPAELKFVSGKTWFDADGRFGIEFSGVLDIISDHLAQVVYEDPNGNYIVEIIYPEGLNPRVLIEEGRVEGITSPNSQVTIHIRNAFDVHKGLAEITADSTGFYSTEFFRDGRKVRIELGDQVTIAKPGQVREMTVNMTHVSYIHPWNDKVFGTVHGIELPAEGSQGRVEVWNVHEQRWYSQYVWIEPDGQYGADFTDVGILDSGSMIRLWATANDGSQQVALGWDLSLGVSTSRNEVWGYTTGNSPVEIFLYRGLVNNEPIDLIGTATPIAQPNGYYSSQVMSDGQPVAISPSNVVIVNTSDHVRSIFVGQVSADVDVVQNRLTVYGPSSAVLHVEGRHSLQSGYVWQEVVLNSAGTATLYLSDFDILPGDVFDLTSYIEEHGLVIHNMIAAPGQPTSPIYLPLVTRTSG
jgi:hypothetical protein